MRRLPEEMPAAYPPGDAGHEFRELITTRAWQVRISCPPEHNIVRVQSAASALHVRTRAVRQEGLQALLWLLGGQFRARRRAPLCHSVSSHGSGGVGREAESVAPPAAGQVGGAAGRAGRGAAAGRARAVPGRPRVRGGRAALWALHGADGARRGGRGRGRPGRGRGRVRGRRSRRPGPPAGARPDAVPSDMDRVLG